METEETIRMVDTLSTRVERISLEELRENTLKDKEEWYNIHPRYEIVYNEFLDEDEYEDYMYMGYSCDVDGYYERVYYDNDVYNAPIEVVDRWIVNYIRHNLTDYEKELKKIECRLGIKEARIKYRILLAKEMKKVYPELQDSIEKNMISQIQNVVE